METLDEEYKPLDYVSVLRMTQWYIGDKVSTTGTVLAVIQTDSNGYVIRLGTNGYSNVVVVRIEQNNGIGIIANDKLKIYGVISGDEEYVDMFGNKLRAPVVMADHFFSEK